MTHAAMTRRSFPPSPPDGWPDEVIGAGQEVPLRDGSLRRYINLDNAATTPALAAVQRAVLEFLPWYASVHRGAGYPSRLSTAAFEDARATVASFLNVNRDCQDVIFVKSATEGLNKVAHALATTGATVFTTLMEHHANLLPWRLCAPAVRYIQTDDAGVIDEEHLARTLRAAPPGPKLLAISGAYNVTGYSPAIHRLALLAHRDGAEILVDGAQLVPHRIVDMQGHAPGEEIDYLVFSAHKVYAPFGAGVLIAPRHLFQGVPDLVGGGAASLVTDGDVVWAGLPDREEAGSPNVVGAIALAAALRRLDELGRAAVAEYEADLTAYALARLRAIPGLTLLGPLDERVAILTFVLAGVPHALVAAILGYEYGIGVRDGRFCAHAGVHRLLRAAAAGEPDVSGAVRASLALYNTAADVDALARALEHIATGNACASYTRQPGGDYAPAGGVPDDDHALPWLAASAVRRW